MNRFRPDRAEVTALVFIAVLAITLLTFPRFVGVADQGDFQRLMRWGGLAYPTLEPHDKYIGWVTKVYPYEKNPFTAWRGAPSSEALFIKSAAVLGLIWSSQTFDLVVLGLLHVLAFVIAWGVLISGWRQFTGTRARVLFPLIAIVFCDIGYLAYFNSFYAEPSSLIFLVATLGLGLMLVSGERSGIPLLIAYHICAGLLVLSKAQNAPFAVALIVFGIHLRFRSPDKRWRRTNLAGMLSMAALTIIGAMVTTPQMKQANLYNSVFNGILRSSTAPDKDLDQLGLPAEYAVLAGTTFFDDNPRIDIRGEDFARKFYEKVGRVSVVNFYLSNPSRLWRMLEITSARAYTLQPPALGNFDKLSGLAYASKATRWSLWSQFKQRYLPHSIWFTLILVATILAAIAFQYRREHNTGLLVLMVAYWMMLGLSLLTPVLGDGENDLEKHLFNFNAILDLFAILLLSQILTKKRNNGIHGTERKVTGVFGL